MNTHKTKDGLKIDVVARLAKPGYFVYVVEICNETEEKLKFDLTKLESKYGFNACKHRDYIIEGMQALRKGQLEPGERITGFILFQSNHNYTTMHEFELNGENFKAKLKIKKEAEIDGTSMDGRVRGWFALW